MTVWTRPSRVHTPMRPFPLSRHPAASRDSVNPACVTLVTSRSSLTGLVARDGAVRLVLDLLPAGEAVDLLRALIGPRADAEPYPLTVLAERCARLPLALRVAAELAVARPARPLADLAAELADERRRLDLLEAGGDPRTAVRAVFSWSSHQLDPGTLRVFWLAGLHPGPDVDAHEVAALADITAERAGQALDFLDRVHLMHNVTAGRYGMHDLLRAYAREVAAAQGVAPATKPDQARDLLDANRASLIALAGHAVAYGWYSSLRLRLFSGMLVPVL